MAIKRCSTLLALALCAMLTACGGGNNDNNDTSNTSSNTPNNTNQSNQTNQSNDPNNEDPCADITQCTAGSSCDGDNSVVCAADANGCLVETTTDCTATDEVCMGGACVDPGSCMDDAECAGMADGTAFCTGDTLTVCAANAEGCLVANTEDCAAGGQTCEDGTPMCVSACTDDVECEGLADGDTYCEMDGSGFTTCAANAQGCLEATPTACNAGEVCDATSGTAVCSASCPEASAAYSCADAGMTIMVDTAAGTSAVADNGCNFFAEDYSANELFFTFSDAANQDVVIEYTYDNANISAVDAFALGGNGVCTDPALTCEGSNFNFGSGTPDTLEFGAAAGQNYYLLFEPYATTETTPIGFTITCTAPVCGDGTIGAGEACDDGNTTDGDGCSAACQIENNWICTGEPSTCIEEICGDGIITASEDCDDGNTGDGDGCDMNCAVEADYICTGEPSTCVPDVCGDGTLSPNESCDDGNTADGDGCSMECEVEFGYQCDATGANCAMVPDIGTFAAGDAIPDQAGGPITGGDSDFYLITFSENVFLDGSATGTTGDLDVQYFDEDGNAPLVSAANGDETWSEVILPAGTYMIELRAFGSTDVATYILSQSTAAVAGTDIGTFNAGATIPNTTGGPLALGENDYYTITFNDAVLLTGTLTSDTGDADLLIRNAGGTEIVAGSAANGDEDFEIGLLAGTYLFQVNAWDGVVDGIGTYTLSLAAAALNPTDIGTFAAGDNVTDQTGTLLDGESDWYTITFSTDVMLSGTLGGNTTGETGVLIYSADTFAVGEFDFGDEAFTDEPVAAGTYIVRVVSNPGDGDVDAYTLTLDPN